MIDVRGPYRIAALCVLISAVLHLIAPLLGGFSDWALRLFPIGFLYLAIAIGLFRGWRWLAYVTLWILMIGGSIALSFVWADTNVPGWLFGAIAFVDLLGVLALFAALWKPNPARAA